MLGGNVCYHHGGNAPQTKAKAQSRLAQAADALVRRLLRFALDGKVADPVAIAAIRDAVDRADLGARQALEFSVGDPKPYEQIMADLAGVAPISREESHARRGQTPQPALAGGALEVVDAEVVDAPDAPASAVPPGTGLAPYDALEDARRRRKPAAGPDNP